MLWLHCPRGRCGAGGATWPRDDNEIGGKTGCGCEREMCVCGSHLGSEFLGFFRLASVHFTFCSRAVECMRRSHNALTVEHRLPFCYLFQPRALLCAPARKPPRPLTADWVAILSSTSLLVSLEDCSKSTIRPHRADQQGKRNIADTSPRLGQDWRSLDA